MASNKDNTFGMQDSSRDQQWQCARCTLLVEIKLLICPMCGARKSRKSRAACPTPDLDLTEEKETPEIQKKKVQIRRKHKRKLWPSKVQKKKARARINSLDNLDARTRERVNRDLTQQQKKNR